MPKSTGRAAEAGVNTPATFVAILASASVSGAQADGINRSIWVCSLRRGLPPHGRAPGPPADAENNRQRACAILLWSVFLETKSKNFNDLILISFCLARAVRAGDLPKELPVIRAVGRRDSKFQAARARFRTCPLGAQAISSSDRSRAAPRRTALATAALSHHR